jgi:hypothetical protein
MKVIFYEPVLLTFIILASYLNDPEFIIAKSNGLRYKILRTNYFNDNQNSLVSIDDHDFIKI